MLLRVLVLTTCAGIALAQTQPQPPDVPKLPRIKDLQQVLNLTDSQVDQLRGIQLQRRQAVMAVKQDPHHRAARQNLQALMRSDNPDATELGLAMIAVRGFERQIQSIHQQAAEDSLAVLDPSIVDDHGRTQVEKLRALRQALRLQPAAHQALAYQLIKPPKARNKQAPPAGQ